MKLFTSFTTALCMPTQTPSGEVQVAQVGEMPVLARIYRLCQEYAPYLEDNFQSVVESTLTEHEALLKKLSGKKKKDTQMTLTEQQELVRQLTGKKKKHKEPGSMKRKEPESATQSFTNLSLPASARSARGSSQPELFS